MLRKWIYSKPVWLKIAVSVILVVIIVLMITSMIQLRRSNSFNSDNLTNELKTLTKVTSHSLDEPLWNYNMEEIYNICEALFKNKAVSGVTVLDKELGVLYHQKIEGEEYDDVYILKSSNSIVHDAENIGYIEIHMTRYFLLQEQGLNVRVRSLEIVILSIILIILISVITTRIMKPLQILKEAVDEVAKGHYHKRIPVIASDEIGELAMKFNEMSTKLQHSQDAISQMNEALETKVEERTMQLNLKNQQLEASMTALEETQQELIESNTSLSLTLETLNETQDQLVQSGKMALLGELVAGVAHEVNTPIGVSLTASSFLQKEISDLNNQIISGQLTKQDLLTELDTFYESATSIVRNLKRAGELINSFKQVAVDQSSHEVRRFVLKKYIHETLLNLHSRYKHRNVTINNTCDETIELLSYPGVYAQIFTNLVINSLIHGFEGKKKGTISISAEHINDRLIIEYSDDGVGIDIDDVNKIFDPFFTTKRGQGGSGLGLNIVYNLVTSVLKGNITCQTEINKGTIFKLDVPYEHPDVNAREYPVL